MVVGSTILNVICFKDVMMIDKSTYGMPNTGCLLGMSFQILLIELADALKKAGLDITPSEYILLRTLYAKDGMQQCEIAELVGKDKGAVSRCVSSLLTKGLVYTEAVSHKCIRVYISEYGRELEPKIMKVAEERHSALESLISIDELKIFTKVLQKIIQNKKGIKNDETCNLE